MQVCTCIWVCVPTRVVGGAWLSCIHALFRQVCWTKDTYYLPIDQDVGRTKKEKPKLIKKISYYQWVALVFTCQAFLFYLPRPLWRMINKKSGISVNTITGTHLNMQPCAAVGT